MFEELVRQLRRVFPMRRPKGLCLTQDFLYEHGNARNALLYAPLFAPELIEVEGSIFMTFGDPETAAQMKAGIATYAGRREELEDLVNMVEVPYSLFSSSEGSSDEDLMLAQFIAEAWRGRLALQFPGRIFKVVVEVPDWLGVPRVSFYEVREPKSS